MVIWTVILGPNPRVLTLYSGAKYHTDSGCDGACPPLGLVR